MRSIRIEFDPSEYRPAEDFDFLGRKAAEVLADLFPGVQVVVKYKKAIETDIRGVTRIEHRLSISPEIVGESIEPVLGQRDWWRQLSLVMSDESKKFLGIGSDRPLPVILVPPVSVDSGGMGGSKAFPPRNTPPEIKYALSISEDVSRAWTIHADQQALPEIKAALAAQLPLWIVAHIAADQCYSFDTYGSGRGKHDILARTVVKVIEYLDSLSSSRVEHQELSHGVVIAPPSRTSKPLEIGTYPDDFRKLKRTPLLVDAIRAVLWISPGGEPIGWITTDSLQKARKRSVLARNQFGPLSFLAVASESLHGLALGLRTDGSIVIFAKGRPLFVRRGEKWRGMLWGSVRKAIGDKYGEVGTVVFDAALILATTGHGGVLGIVESLPEGLHKKDRVDIVREKISNLNLELAYPEWLFHALLPIDQVLSLGSSTVAMLAAIDGATVLNREGKLLAYGAVIPSCPSGSEGARSAAARELSNNGFVIKVSADGPITLYKGGQPILEV